MSEEHDDRRLHRYFDGDLSPEEATEVRRRLDAEPAMRAKLGGLREVRALVRETVAPALVDLPSDDLWARIEARIDAAAAVPGAADDARATPEKVAPPTAAPAKAAPEKVAPEAPRLRAVDGGLRDAAVVAPREVSRGRRVLGIAIAGLALAAAILLLVVRPGEDGPDEGTLADGGDLTGEGGGGGETAEELVFRTEVLEVDFGANSGAIFAVEGEDGERYAVVWLADVQPKQTAVE